MSIEDDIRASLHSNTAGVGETDPDLDEVDRRIDVALARRKRAQGAAVATVIVAVLAVTIPNLLADRNDGLVEPGPDGELILSCGSENFPVSVFEQPADAEDRPGAPEAALRSVTRRTGWRVITRAPSQVVFARGEPPLLATTRIEEVEPGRWAKTGQGPCPTLIERDGIRPGNWALDPTMPTPTEASTTIHILVEEVECHSFEPVLPRLQEPDIEYTDGAVTISIYFTPPPGPGQTCPGTPAEQTSIELGEPLGDRVLLDGGRYPAAPGEVSFPPMEDRSQLECSDGRRVETDGGALDSGATLPAKAEAALREYLNRDTILSIDDVEMAGGDGMHDGRFDRLWIYEIDGRTVARFPVIYVRSMDGWFAGAFEICHPESTTILAGRWSTTR
jgi:hypothetical protein